MNQLKSIHISRGSTHRESADIKPGLKILVYSHDSWGLGHFRRNLAISGALVRRLPHANVLMVSGSPCATQFSLPERCDVVKLPAVGKDSDGCYVSRSLAIPLNEALALRRQLIKAAYESFNPDVVLVDHQLTGMLGEAQDMVRTARAAGKLTIFGMRDIVDSASVVEQAWSSQECRNALASDYGLICVYGDKQVFDAISEYPFLKPYQHKISNVGYIVSPLDKAKRRPVPSLNKQVLVTVGGGEDGAERIEAYLAALDLAPFDWNTHIVTGPLMDESKVRAFKRKVARAGYARSVRISRFYRNIPGLLQQADAVVSMAGYNSCTEILQSGRAAVLLPRDRMRHEQRIRAERLAARGLVHSLEGLDPSLLRQAVEKALDCKTIRIGLPELNGLDNMCELIEQMTDLTAARSSVHAMLATGLLID